MAEEIAFENGRISNFEGIMTLTLDRVILALHTVVHHSSMSTYTPNFIEIEETFLWTDGRNYVWTFVTGYIRLTLKSRPTMGWLGVVRDTGNSNSIEHIRLPISVAIFHCF